MRLLVLLAWGLPLLAQKLDDPAIIARGQEAFATTCGIGYCHGSEGAAGKGPRLAGRRWDPQYLLKVIRNGSENRLMPPFAGQMREDEIWAVIAYVLSLGPGGAAGAVGPNAAASDTPPAPEVEAGRAIFFDSANPKRCAICHAHGGRGADVAPDLTNQASRPARDILRDILEPDARLAGEPVTVVTKAGERLTGVKRQETRELIRLYDTASLPPVLRTIYKDQIASVTPEKRSPMPADYGRGLSRQQLRELVSFLKGAPVAPQDLEGPPER
jgi:putative heme-binding domain-containing protein